MGDILLGMEYLQELEAEANATRRCLERIPGNLFSWKPHEKSMTMGYMAQLVAEIPKWLTYIIEISEIDFATFEHDKAENAEDLVRNFDNNMEGARNALRNVLNEALADLFYLKNNGQVLYSSSKKENIFTSINHMVHHRGQLTVYMRLNDIAVPSIYGPSADEKTF